MGSGGGNPVKKIEKEVNRFTEKNPWVPAVTNVLLPETLPLGIGLTIDNEIVDPMEKAKRDARDAVNRQREEMNRTIEDIRKETAKNEEKASASGTAAKEASRKAAKPKRRATILTSALGVPSEPESAGKTLLGR